MIGAAPFDQRNLVYYDGGSTLQIKGGLVSNSDGKERRSQRWIVLVILGLVAIPIMLVTGTLVAGLDGVPGERQQKISGPLDGAGLPEPAAMRNIGARLFSARCQTCHGYQGRGGIGPSLRDATWLHGSQEADIYRSIAEGYPDKGMIAWGGLLTENELRSLVVFLKSLPAE
jgi:cytochrome c553